MAATPDEQTASPAPAPSTAPTSQASVPTPDQASPSQPPEASPAPTSEVTTTAPEQPTAGPAPATDQTAAPTPATPQSSTQTQAAQADAPNSSAPISQSSAPHPSSRQWVRPLRHLRHPRAPARRRRTRRQSPPRHREHHSRQARRRLHRKAPRPAPLQRARIRSPGLTSRQGHSPPQPLRSRRTPVRPRPARMWLRHLTSKRRALPQHRPRAGPDEFTGTSRDGGCPSRLLHQPHPEPGPSSHACSRYTEPNS